MSWGIRPQRLPLVNIETSQDLCHIGVLPSASIPVVSRENPQAIQEGSGEISRSDPSEPTTNTFEFPVLCTYRMSRNRVQISKTRRG